MIEVLSRLRLPIAPALPDEVARKADLGAHYGASPPLAPGNGYLWATPGKELFIWTGAEWLRIIGPEGTVTTNWDSGAVWNAPGQLWG